jgi:hypothetical protein
MINPKALSTPPTIYNPYLIPDNYPITEITDWTLGGIGLQDPSQGLQVQNWYLEIVPNGLNGDFYISTSTIAPIYLFSRVNATWGRLSFDQNMFPVISYVDQYGAGYYWYDPIAHSYAFVVMDSTVTYPCVTMDDKRPIATRVGSNDIILAYINNNNLCFRAQRDRYGTEYVLQVNVGNYIPNPTLWRIGMNSGNRLQFELHGNLWQ